jgi:hypothetical protein
MKHLHQVSRLKRITEGSFQGGRRDWHGEMCTVVVERDHRYLIGKRLMKLSHDEGIMCFDLRRPLIYSSPLVLFKSSVDCNLSSRLRFLV